MSKQKKASRSRWTDPHFQLQMMPTIQKLITPPVVLDGADIAGVTIGQEGPIQALWDNNLYQASILDSNLDFIELACSANAASLTRTSLVGAKLDRCSIMKSTVDHCDFSEARLVVNLDDSVFRACNFTGATFAGGKLLLEYGGRRVKFFGCDFTDALFKRVEFRASEFVDCVFVRTKFQACDLRGVKVTGAEIFEQQFEDMAVPEWSVSGEIK